MPRIHCSKRLSSATSSLRTFWYCTVSICPPMGPGRDPLPPRCCWLLQKYAHGYGVMGRCWFGECTHTGWGVITYSTSSGVYLWWLWEALPARWVGSTSSISGYVFSTRLMFPLTTARGVPTEALSRSICFFPFDF